MNRREGSERPATASLLIPVPRFRSARAASNPLGINRASGLSATPTARTGWRTKTTRFKVRKPFPPALSLRNPADAAMPITAKLGGRVAAAHPASLRKWSRVHFAGASQPNPSRFSPAPCELAGLVGSQRLEQRTSRPVICDHSFQPQSDARRTAIGIVTVLPVTEGPISQADCPSARSQSIGRGPV
jgi:hypothetical protein